MVAGGEREWRVVMLVMLLACFRPVRTENRKTTMYAQNGTSADQRQAERQAGRATNNDDTPRGGERAVHKRKNPEKSMSYARIIIS